MRDVAAASVVDGKHATTAFQVFRLNGRPTEAKQKSSTKACNFKTSIMTLKAIQSLFLKINAYFTAWSMAKNLFDLFKTSINVY